MDPGAGPAGSGAFKAGLDLSTVVVFLSFMPPPPALWIASSKPPRPVPPPFFFLRLRFREFLPPVDIDGGPHGIGGGGGGPHAIGGGGGSLGFGGEIATGCFSFRKRLSLEDDRGVQTGGSSSSATGASAPVGQ